MGQEFLTPPGRLVGGSPFEGNDKDFQGAPLVIKTGANAGQPRIEYFVQIAIPKTDPGYPAFLATIVAESRAAFPTLFDAAGACIFPAFAFKVTDGDSTAINQKGKRPCDREGFPGNWIVNFSGGFPPKCYTKDGAAVLVDPASIKRGYWVRVSGMCNGNGNPQNPGVYLNPGLVELLAYDTEISSGPDAATVFGGNSVTALPAGASATPLASAAPIALPAPVPGTPGVPVAASVAAPVPLATVPAPIPGVAPVAVPGVAPVAVVADPAFLQIPAPLVAPAPVAPVAVVAVAPVPLAPPVPVA